MTFKSSGTVIVTGASRGIGYAISARLIEAGYSVVGLARDAARLDVARAELGPGFTGAPANIGDDDDIRRVMGGLDGSLPLVGLVNNAGVSQLGPSDEMAAGEFDSVMSINVTSVFTLSVEAYRIFRAQGTRGSIVNITSIDAFRGHAKMAAYTASKFAVRGLTQSLALEWARHDIRVNSVAPGAVRTDMTEHLTPGSKGFDYVIGKTPLRRISEPSEVAGAVAFLIGPEASYITGTHLSVDGGFTA